MNEQIPHRDVGVTEIGTENRFTEEIVKSAAGGMTAEKCAALVPRAIKLNVAGLDIVNEATEKWRQHLRLIFFCGLINLATVKITIGRVGIQNAVKGLVGQGDIRFAYGKNR